MATISKRILRGVTYTAAEKITVQVLSLVSFFVIINNISLKDFGLLHLLFTFMGPAASISMLGIERLVVSDIAVYRAKEAYGTIRRLLQEYLTVTIFLLSALFMLSWVLRDFLTQFYDADLTFFYWGLVFLIVGQIGMNFTSIMFEAYERFNYSLAAKITEAAVRLGIVLSFFVWFSFSLQSVFWAYIIGKLVAMGLSVVLGLTLFRSQRDTAGSATTEEKGVLVSILKRHGKWEMVSHILKTGANNLAPWLLNFLVSTEGVALYAFVMKINSLFGAALPVRSALFPIFSHSIATSKKLAIAIATKLKKYLFVTYFVLYALIFFFVDPFIAVFAPQYGDAGNLVRLAMLHLFVDVLTLGQPVVFYALKKQKMNFAISSYAVGATVVTQILFTYLWGIEGLILSWLFVGLSLVVVREYVLRAKLDFPLLNLRACVEFDEYDRMLLRQIGERLRLRRSTKE